MNNSIHDKLFWGKLMGKVLESNFSSEEFFFLDHIRKGLKLQDETLSEVDIDALASTIDSEGLSKMDNLFNENSIDRLEWNDRLVEALRKSFEHDVENMGADKEFFKKHNMPYQDPHESWDLRYNELVGNSRKVISGIVQNWDKKYWRSYARKSAAKSMSTGCVLPVIMFIFIFVLIPIVLL